MATGRPRFLDWLVLAAVVAFLGTLAWYLARPGFGPTRLALFAALGGFAVAGGAGVVRRDGQLTTAGVAGLLALGFWQTVLWLYVYPLVALLVLAGLVTGRTDRPTAVAR